MESKKVLIAEDSSVIQNLTKKILQIQNYQIFSAKNGLEVLSMLENDYYDIILMDINMPKMDGREFLEKIKGDTALTSIPLVVLTTSNDIEDINHSYGNLANCFILKPVDLSKFVEVVQAIEYFWLKIVKLPS